MALQRASSRVAVAAVRAEIWASLRYSVSQMRHTPKDGLDVPKHLLRAGGVGERRAGRPFRDCRRRRRRRRLLIVIILQVQHDAFAAACPSCDTRATWVE